MSRRGFGNSQNKTAAKKGKRLSNGPAKPNRGLPAPIIRIDDHHGNARVTLGYMNMLRRQLNASMKPEMAHGPVRELTREEIEARYGKDVAK